MLKRLSAFFLDIFEVIIFAVAIFLFLYLLIMQPHIIKGASMEPNYPDGELLLTDKVSYRFGSPKRGDVIVFKPPVSPSEEFIKRIIGLPGEKVMIKGNKVYINGEELKESYISSSLATSSGNFLQEGKEFTVPENEYIVFGDNRPDSSDSRNWGPVSKNKITGRAWLIYWPIGNAGLVETVTYNF